MMNVIAFLIPGQSTQVQVSNRVATISNLSSFTVHIFQPEAVEFPMMWSITVATASEQITTSFATLRIVDDEADSGIELVPEAEAAILAGDIPDVDMTQN